MLSPSKSNHDPTSSLEEKMNSQSVRADEEQRSLRFTDPVAKEVRGTFRADVGCLANRGEEGGVPFLPCSPTCYRLQCPNYNTHVLSEFSTKRRMNGHAATSLLL